MPWHIDVDLGGFPIDEGWLRRVASTALDMEGVAGPGEASVHLVTDERIRELNRRYRDLDEPTDVLSFGYPDAEPSDFVLPPGSVRQLGEVVIAFPYVARQAEEAGQPLESELAHVLVHGLLHLLGYDHATPMEEALMRSKEEAVLAALGLGHSHA